MHFFDVFLRWGIMPPAISQMRLHLGYLHNVEQSMPRVGWSWWWDDCGTVTSHLPAGHLLSHEGIACLACHSPTRLRHPKVSSDKIPNLTFCLCMIYATCRRLSSYIPCHGLLSSTLCNFPPKVELFEEVRKTNPIQKVWTKSVHWWKDAVLEQRGRRSR